MENQTTKISKLSDSNYHKWSYDIKLVLQTKGLWKNVENATLADYVDEMNDGVSEEEDKVKMTGKDRVEWKENNEKCMAIIGLSVSDRYTQTIKESTTPKEIWVKLKALCTTTDRSLKFSLQSQFFEAKMNEKETLINYVDRVVGIVEKLKEIGSEIEEEIICFKILYSLQERYRPIIMTCMMIPENEFKVATLRNHFVMEVSTKQKAEKPKEVLFTQHTPSHNKNQTKKEVTCFKCGTKGHIAKECRAPPWKIEKFEKEKEGKTPNQKPAGSKPSKFKKGEKLLNVETLNVEEKDESDDCWYIDSGCTQHMTNRKEWLSNLEEIETFVIGPISKKLEKVNLKGDCVLKNVGDYEIRLQNTLFVSGIRRNLISVKSLCKAGARTTFQGDKFEVSKEGSVLLRGQINSIGLFAVQQITEFNKGEEDMGWREHGLAVVPGHSPTHSTEPMLKEEEEEIDQSPETVEIKEEMFNIESNNKLMLWHKRLGHLSIKQMKKLHSQEELEGLKEEDFKQELYCEVCCLGKQATNKLNKSHKLNTKERGELIHSDVCGPISPDTKGGNRYYVSFIDDFTRKSWVFLIKNKDEVLEKFKEFYTLMETQHNIKIKSILSDGGGEYVNGEFKKFAKEKGFIQRITPPYTPQRNGLAERFNRTIMEKVRCMIITANLKKEFWGEAVNYANYIRNCSPTKLKEKTPEEEFTGVKPRLMKLKVFGANAVVKNKSPKRKLDNRGIVGKMVGYNEDNHTYRIWNNEKKKLIFSKDVRFISEGEPKLINEHTQEKLKSSEEVEIILGDKKKKKAEDNNDVRGGSKQPSTSSSNSNTSEESDSSDDEENKQVQIEVIDLENDQPRGILVKPTQGRPRRESKQVQFFGNPKVYMIEGEKEKDVPITYYQMLKDGNRDKWLESTKTELNSLLSMDTWDIVDREKNKPTITSKWLWKTKYLPNGQIDKYKTRMVARGYTQKKGINYNETFAPVVRFETLRYLLAHAVEKELEVHHMDVETAFLNGNLEEEIFMEIPDGLKLINNQLLLKSNEDYKKEFKKEKSEKVLKLKKSLYGLKQSPRCWNTRLTIFLKEKNFIQSKTDPCLFMRSEEDNTKTIIAIYVDDCFILGKGKIIEVIKNMFNKEFKMKDNGELSGFLGVNVERKENYLTIDQEFYIENMLKRFNMMDCKTVSTPMAVEPKGEEKSKEEEKKFDTTIYQSAIGSLIYLSIATRPDISYAVNQAAQAMQSPNEGDWQRVKRIFRYLKGTKSLKLKYLKNKEKENITTGYSDASYAENRKDRKSTSGYIFLKANGAISWKSKKQPIVSLSSMEAEYIALTSAAKEAMWLQKLNFEIEEKAEAILIYEDNQSTIKTASEEIYNDRSKHIDVRYHFIREKVRNNQIKVEYLPTEDMIADALTKPLGSVKVSYFNNLLGLTS